MKPIKKKDNKVVISDEEWSGKDSNQEQILCPYCDKTLLRLTDHGGNNHTYYCNTCQVSHLSETTRKIPKLGTQHKEVEPAVTSIDFTPDVSIHREPEPKGAFAELQKKGLKITNYKEDVG
jgi:hypothetical protein